VLAAVETEHRRHGDIQLVPVTTIHRETGGQVGQTGGHRLLQPFDPGGHLLPRDHAEQRSTQADPSLILPGQAGELLVGRCLQQHLGLPVVEEDLSMDIADQHTGRQLRHQRGEAVALLQQVRPGLIVCGLDLPLQFLVGVSRGVDDSCQVCDFPRPDGGDPVVGVGEGDQLG